MTPLEAVARAICIAHDDDPDALTGFNPHPQWNAYSPIVRIALEALREPSEGMLMSGTAALDPIKGQTAFPTDEEAAVVWQAMLTAALGEQP